MGYNRSGNTRKKREKRRNKHNKRLMAKAEQKMTEEAKASAAK